jgi:hypothetical protein
MDEIDALILAGVFLAGLACGVVLTIAVALVW